MNQYFKEGHEPEARSFQDFYAKAYEELLVPPPATHLKRLSKLDQMIGGLRPNEFSILCGATGCLSGSSRIRVHRNGKGFELTIQQMYEQWIGVASNNKWDLSQPTFVRSYDGVGIRLHKIKGVMISGIKETVRLVLSSKKEIRLTPDHLVLTENGWVRAGLLTPDHRVAVDTLKPRKRPTQKAKTRDTYFGGVKYHPFSTKCNDDRRIVIHRAIYEAHMNKLSLNAFLETVRENKSAAASLLYINPKTTHVHHKNHDHYDNRIENLEILPALDHYKEHGDYSNFGQGAVNWISVESVTAAGIEAVYDIECEDPHHNFVANGMVVHNSGKTTLCANISADLVQQGIPHYVASVETGPTDYMKRIMSVYAREDLNSGDPIRIEKARGLHAQYGDILQAQNQYLALYDNRIPLEKLLADLSHMAIVKGAKLAILDNFNFFLDCVKASDERQEMDRIVHELIIFCKHVPLHIIMVMHPKKTMDGRVESEFDIKGSSTSVQEAQNVFLFNRPHQDLIDAGKATIMSRELKIAKVRRRGKYVGHRLILNSYDGTSYTEGDVVR